MSNFAEVGNFRCGTKIRYGPPPVILGTPFIPRGQYEPGLSEPHISEGWILEGVHRAFQPVPGPRWGAPGGAQGSAGGAVALGDSQGWAQRPRWVLPAGCIRRRAGRRLRRRQRGAFPTSRAAPCSSGWPAPTQAAGSTAAFSSSNPPAGPRPPYLHLQPARLQAASSPSGPARRGPARPDPVLAVRESARRSDGYEIGSLRPFFSHRLPLFAPAERATTAARPMGEPTCERHALPPAIGSTSSQSRAAWLGRRAHGGGVRQAPQGWRAWWEKIITRDWPCGPFALSTGWLPVVGPSCEKGSVEVGEA